MARTMTKRRLGHFPSVAAKAFQSLGPKGGPSDLAPEPYTSEDLEIAPLETNTLCEEQCHVHSITGSHVLSVCSRLVWLSWPLSSSPEGARSSWSPGPPLRAFDLGPIQPNWTQ